MKKLSLFVMPLMAVSFLASCGGSKEPAKVSYTLTYIYDNGSTDKYVETYTEDEKTQKPTWEPVYSGYTFDGWFTKSGEEGSKFDFGGALTTNTVVYAHWTENPTPETKYKITFYKDSVYYDEITGIEVNSLIDDGDLPENPEKEGYTFTGWYTDTEYKNKFDFKTIRINQDYELNAGWEPIVPATTYAITFMNDTKVGEITGINPGAIITKQTEGFPEDPSKTGYTFIGWCTDEAGKNVFDFPNMPIYHNHTLYAGFEKNITISFKNDGQPYGDGVEIEKGTIIPSDKRPTDPAKQDYTFIGWGSDTSGEHLVDLSTTKFYEDTTLHANWSGEITYEVNAEEFNEAISMENETYLQCASYLDNFGSSSMQISEQASYMETSLEDGFVNVYQYLNGSDEKYYQITNTGGGWSEPALTPEAQVLTPAGIGDDIVEELALRTLTFANFNYGKSVFGVGSYIYSNENVFGYHIEIEFVFVNKRLMSYTLVEYHTIIVELETEYTVIDRYQTYQMAYDKIVPPDPRNP